MEKYIDPALAFERWVQGNANCAFCGRLIETEDCVVLNPNYPMTNCMCLTCKKQKEQVLSEDMPDEVYEIVADYINLLDDFTTATPHDDYKEG